MSDHLVVSGLPNGRVGVSYRPEGVNDAEAFGEPAPFVSPLSAQDLADLTWYLERYLLAPYAVYAEKGTAIEGRLQGWGEALFEPLFGLGRPARDAYQRAREHQAELVIRWAAPGFLALPWELLKDPDRPTPLALDLRGISRSCDVKATPIAVPPGEELRVLMVIARPAGLDDVDFQMVAAAARAAAGCARRGPARHRPADDTRDARGLPGPRARGGPALSALHFDGHGVFAAGARAAGMFDMAEQRAGGSAVTRRLRAPAGRCPRGH